MKSLRGTLFSKQEREIQLQQKTSSAASKTQTTARPGGSMSGSDYSSFSDDEVDSEYDVAPSYEEVQRMPDEELQGIPLTTLGCLDDRTLEYLGTKRKKLTRDQRLWLKRIRIEIRRCFQRGFQRGIQEGIQEGIASTRETVEEALQKHLFSNIVCVQEKLTAPAPATWALPLTSIKPWIDFDGEVISDPHFQNSGVLGGSIAKIIFDPLENFDICAIAAGARRDFLQKVCNPLERICAEVDAFPRISIQCAQEIGLALKSDINLSAVEIENGEQVYRVFCVIEAARPNQLLTEDGGLTNQTVEKRRERAPKIGVDDYTCGHIWAGLRQLLGYMVIYGLKYGVLTSFELTYFCKRNEEGEIWVSKGFYGIQNDGDVGVNLAMAAFVYKILHDKDKRLPYPSMESQSVGVQAFYRMCQESWGGKQVDKSDTLEILEKRIGKACADFIRSTIKREANQSGQEDEIEALRNRVASLLPLSEEAFSMPLPWEDDFKLVAEGAVRIPWISYKGFTWNVFVKALRSPKDWLRWAWAESKETFLKEIEFYKGPLHKLQGLYIPFLVYGGVFHSQVIIATTSSGVTATEELVFTHRDWAPRSIRESLARVHQAGVLHGDIAWRNIALNLESKTAHLIDFGRATQHEDSKKFEKFQAKEKEALEALLSCVSPRKRLRDSF